MRLIFFPIHITLRGKNAPIYSKESSLKDGGHIDTRTTTTDELSRDFEEQSAAAKRNRYAFMREYLSSVRTFSFLLPENPIGDCLSVFRRPAKDFARSSLFTHRFSLSLSFKQENNNNNRKERRPHRPGLHHHPDNNNRRRRGRRFWGRSRFLGRR